MNCRLGCSPATRATSLHTFLIVDSEVTNSISNGTGEFVDTTRQHTVARRQLEPSSQMFRRRMRCIRRGCS
jgi:hypothetical protein